MRDKYDVRIADLYDVRIADLYHEKHRRPISFKASQAYMRKSLADLFHPKHRRHI
jgi:hypothetical protein